jgi:phosphoglycerate dehydrogenase-like enzyme
MSVPFRVGVTRDFLRPDGTLGFGDVGLGLLDGVPGLTWEFLSDDVLELSPDQVRDFDALLVLSPRVTATTLEGSSRLSVVARFGVGYDSVDVDACTRHGVLLTITPDGVRRPLALAVLTFLLALSHKMLVKDRLTRAGRWAEKVDHMGTDVTGRTLGVVGLGNVGREVFELAKPLGMRHLAHDPYAGPADAVLAGAELVSLEELLGAADFVCLCCALTPQTHHLIDGRRLALMKPSAYLINVSRGPVVDQKALTEVLRQRRIAGAGLDVFEQEPIDPGDPILTFDNVIVAPHALSWTDGCFRAIGSSACRSILDVAAGRTPNNVVNRAALAAPRVQEKLRRYAQRGAGR